MASAAEEKKEKKDRDTALRLIAMLSHIPIEPRSVTVATIQQRLKESGYDIHVRGIQRDLHMLSGKFPLIATQGEGNSLLWSFIKGTSNQWPAMDVDAALGLVLAHNNLKEQLPSTVLQSLEPVVGQAQSTIDTLDKSGYKKVMTKHLRILPRHLQLQKAEIKPEVLSRVFDSLLRKRQLEIEFRGRRSVVNPLGLVVRGAVTYLVCTFDGYGAEDYRTPALHRITQADVQAKDAAIPLGFDLDAVIASGRLQWILDEKLQKFELEVHEDMVAILEETPINDTQIIHPYDEEEGNGWYRVTFEAPYTMELRHWLMSMSDNIVVTKPAKIRKEFRELAKMMVEYYEE